MVVAVAMVSLLGDEKRAPRSCCNPQTHIFLSRIVSKALWEDKTISKISLPYTVMQSNKLDTIQDVAETVCYSRLVEAYMIDNFKQSEFQYFGANNGLFRQISALGRNNCGSYDPRIRPWFVAAASGPKDVVLVIAGTNSMERIDGALKVTREAAKAVIGTLNVDDRFTVLAFTNDVYVLLEGGSTFIPVSSVDITDLILLRATSVNQNNAIEAINNLTPEGQADIYTAFETAFDTIYNTLEKVETSGGPIAILFISDDQISETADTLEEAEFESEKILGLIENRTQQFESRPVSRKVTIFTYSLGGDSDHDLLKNISCKTGGIWTLVDNEDLVAEMSSYYKLFALGLDRKGVATWVEPYTFFSKGVLGTTVSVPVYDRNFFTNVPDKRTSISVCVYVCVCMYVCVFVWVIKGSKLRLTTLYCY
jgi:hypothetical protein